MPDSEKESISQRNERMRRGAILNIFTGIPMMLAIGTLFFLKGLPDSYLYSLAFFIGGFSGVIIIIRKEVPTSIWTIRGNAAILRGVFLIIVFWGAALYILIAGL
jgi:hypothetical protein